MPDHMPDPVESLRQYLESLRQAGIDYLPRQADVPLAEAAAAPAKPAADEGSLFAGTEGGLSLEDRRVALAVLQEEVKKCDRCPELASTRSKTVFGVGPLSPDLCFIGEAPGADEDRQGEPFVGAAGQLLNRIIEACGMKREEVFICNILRCRPPANRVPKAEEAANCRGFLEKTIELVAPKFICALGATAAQNLLKTRTPIGKLRGKFFEFQGIPVICTYHPASLLPSRSPEKKKDVWEDMKMLLRKMGKPIPGPKGGQG